MLNLHIINLVNQKIKVYRYWIDSDGNLYDLKNKSKRVARTYIRNEKIYLKIIDSKSLISGIIYEEIILKSIEKLENIKKS